MGFLVYKLKVSITTYLIFLPIVKAVLEGSVQGVVVHARKNKSESVFSSLGRLLFKTLNIAVIDTSLTSL